MVIIIAHFSQFTEFWDIELMYLVSSESLKDEQIIHKFDTYVFSELVYF